MTKLNLGCSDRIIPGFTSVDLAPPADQIVDLSSPWPWETSSVEEILALDVIEHIGDCTHAFGSTYCGRCIDANNELCMLLGIPLGSTRPGKYRHAIGRIHFMNELHRVLEPGARATIETPNAARGSGYFQDPTHVSPWCLSSFKYFESGAFAHQRLSKAYGITAAFKAISLTERETSGEDPRETAWKITAILEAVK